MFRCLLLLASLAASASPLSTSSLYCSEQRIFSSKEPSTRAFSSAYTFEINSTCDSAASGGKTAQFILFSPPETGNYYAKIVPNNAQLVMDVRYGACNIAQDTYVTCTNRLQSPVTTGFDQIFLTVGRTYAFLIVPFDTSKTEVETQNTLSVAYCGTNCINGGTGGGPNQLAGVFDELIALQTASTVVPAVLIGITLIASQFFYCAAARNVAGGYGVPTETFVAVREQAVITWTLSTVVWFSTWSVTWGYAAYAFATVTFLFAVYAFYLFGRHNCGDSIFVQRNRRFRVALNVLAVWLCLNAVIVIVYLALAGEEAFSLCANSYPGDSSCTQYFTPRIAYGAVAAFSMFALAASTYVLGNRFRDISGTIKLAGGRTVGAVAA